MLKIYNEQLELYFFKRSKIPTKKHPASGCKKVAVKN